MTSEEVRAWGEASGTGGTEPEGRERLRSAYVRFFAKSSHCAGYHPTQKSQVMSSVQIFPLHLGQVGWGSLSKEDRNAPHFRPPTPGQILNSPDIRKKEYSSSFKKLKRHQSTINVNKADDEGQDTTERGLYLTVVEQRMTVEPIWGGSSHPSS